MSEMEINGGRKRNEKIYGKREGMGTVKEKL